MQSISSSESFKNFSFYPSLPLLRLLVLLLLLQLQLLLSFFHSFLLFCVSRARIKIVFVCGSACWFRLLSEM